MTTANIGQASPETGPWEAALEQLRDWDPAWAETCTRMATNPWRSGVLPRRLVELIGVALNAACTNLNPEGTRRHIRRALNAGATKEEILLVLKLLAGSLEESLAALEQDHASLNTARYSPAIAGDASHFAT